MMPSKSICLVKYSIQNRCTNLYLLDKVHAADGGGAGFRRLLHQLLTLAEGQDRALLVPGKAVGQQRQTREVLQVTVLSTTV